MLPASTGPLPSSQRASNLALPPDLGVPAAGSSSGSVVGDSITGSSGLSIEAAQPASPQPAVAPGPAPDSQAGAAKVKVVPLQPQQPHPAQSSACREQLAYLRYVPVVNSGEMQVGPSFFVFFCARLWAARQRGGALSAGRCFVSLHL